MEYNERVPRSELDKSFMLHDNGSYLNGLKIKKVDSVENVEKLSLFNFHDQTRLESTIEQFPNVRILIVSKTYHRTNDEIISILSKCKQLETLTIGTEWSNQKQDEDEVITDYRLNVQFHEKFINTLTNPQFKIEFMMNDKIYGVITKDEIVWRNKLLHWTGYNPALSQSKVQLLDLVSIPKESKAKHKQPLNLIFNYLDLNCLYTFCLVNKECKQLVHNYIYQRCKQHSSKQRSNQRSIHRAKLTFNCELYINYNALRLFGKNISNLEINLMKFPSGRLRQDVEKYCKNVSILWFRSLERCDPENFILPNIRHYIYFGYGLSSEYIFFCELNIFSKRCPDLEVFEIRTPIKLYTCNNKKVNSFRNLKQFIFKPYDESQVKFAQDFFKDSATQVIVIP